ncbi:MAG: VCBS repeat-containing protein [Elusimicrobia bacterium]|nr:VCBS repeat-containing protein [Elusimicrobiota bacterium]
MRAIVNDRFATWMISALGYTNIVDGDFDGDGHMDLAIVAKSATDGHTEVNLFLGQHSNPPSSFSTNAHLRVFVNSSFHVPIEMVDVNLDHKEDLVLGDWEKHGDKGQVSIILGEKGVTRTVDMTNTLPDVQIIGEPGSYLGFAFGRGDFNGDKNVDLFLGGWQKSYFMFGRSGMTSGTNFDLSVATFPRISMNLYDSSVGILGHDIDHDGDDDLIVPSAHIDIIHGDPNFPSRPVTDLRVVRSPTTNAIFCPAVGDLTGDGRPEMVIVGYSLLPVFRPLSAVLNGSDLLSGQSVVNLDPASVNPVTPQALPVSIRSIFSSAIGDFDGDGKNDLFFVGTSTEGVLQPYLWAYLSSGFEGKNPLESLQTPTFVWDRPFECIKLVDMNGDGLKDLVTYDNVGSLAPFGAIRIMYGYRLLLNPTVSIGPRQGNSPRASLTLSVEGDPVEMMISGDIVDSFKDQWIPYQTHPDVTFLKRGLQSRSSPFSKCRPPGERNH